VAKQPARKKVAPAKKPRGKTATHHKIIRRLFNGLPVVDAKEEITIHAVAADIKAAKRGDPLNCVFARTCERIFGSHNTAFWRKYAYVQRGGKLERYSLPQATRDSIMMWDKAGKAEPGGYLLRPPAPSDTLDSRLARSRATRGPRKIWVPVPRKKRKPAPDVNFRSGKGIVQFLKAQKSWVRA
jgi:hypothetical protein